MAELYLQSEIYPRRRHQIKLGLLKWAERLAMRRQKYSKEIYLFIYFLGITNNWLEKVEAFLQVRKIF